MIDFSGLIILFMVAAALVGLTAIGSWVWFTVGGAISSYVKLRDLDRKPSLSMAGLFAFVILPTPALAYIGQGNDPLTGLFLAASLLLGAVHGWLHHCSKDPQSAQSPMEQTISIISYSLCSLLIPILFAMIPIGVIFLLISIVTI